MVEEARSGRVQRSRRRESQRPQYHPPWQQWPQWWPLRRTRAVAAAETRGPTTTLIRPGLVLAVRPAAVAAEERLGEERGAGPLGEDEDEEGEMEEGERQAEEDASMSREVRRLCPPK